ncbi:hypothetical protein JHK87_027539 [Glycine soja]|nr:hypothetical protein JHK87_027539 [Glycine soja]
MVACKMLLFNLLPRHRKELEHFGLGFGPNIARNDIINVTELANYDKAKQVMKKTLDYILELFLKIDGFTDNVVTHLLAGLGVEFCAVYAGSPVDVDKLLDNTSVTHLFPITKYLGLLATGMTADARALVQQATNEATEFRFTYGYEMPYNCDLINMSYGEATLLPDYGCCFVDLVNEVVNKHRLIFVSSPGNKRPG